MSSNQLYQSVLEARRAQIEPIKEAFFKDVVSHEKIVDTRVFPDSRQGRIREIGETCLQRIADRIGRGGDTRTMLEYTRIRNTFYELVYVEDQTRDVSSSIQLLMWTAESGRVNGEVLDEWLTIHLCDALWTYFGASHSV